MALVVNTNVASLIAQRSLERNSTSVQQSMERLSSGFRINRAGDDVAGLAISENLIGEIQAGKKALQNAQDGLSILQVAEGGLTTITNNLQRMRELAVQAANDTNDQNQRNAIAREIRALADDIDRISLSTNFNGIQLLDGSVANARLQIGSSSPIVTDTLDISLGLVDSQTTSAAGLLAANPFYDGVVFNNANDLYNPATDTTALTSTANAQQLMSNVENYLNQITSQRSTIGALQNQLDSIINNLSQAIENFSASNSRIRDLDVAEETAKLVRGQILQQASVSVLGQANSNPELILGLLQQ
ncbi:MAG: flagellin [Vampirovibrio sp.]|nr:flagellin [Vampirovibrio sp.]